MYCSVGLLPGSTRLAVILYEVNSEKTVINEPINCGILGSCKIEQVHAQVHPVVTNTLLSSSPQPISHTVVPAQH